MRRPSNNSITLGYGAVDPALGYTSASPHAGTDFSHSPDDLIYAPENGTINFVGWMGTAGNAVELSGTGGRKWRLCHMSSFNVFQGQTVGEGHVLGVMGSTGYAVGKHLHLILFINGNRTDPMSILGTVGGGTKLMTPNFIIRTYVGFQGRQPTQDEINFHMANSNPESFVNGFGEAFLWRSQQDQLNQLQAKVNELNATLARKDELEASEDVTEAAVQSELSAAKNRIGELTTELETARAAINNAQTTPPVIVTQPTTEPAKPKLSLFDKLILAVFGKKNK